MLTCGIDGSLVNVMGLLVDEPQGDVHGISGPHCIAGIPCWLLHQSQNI